MESEVLTRESINDLVVGQYVSGVGLPCSDIDIKTYVQKIKRNSDGKVIGITVSGLREGDSGYDYSVGEIVRSAMYTFLPNEPSLNTYNRQKNLNLKVPPSIAVIGIGGVGSWVAFQFAMIGTKKLLLIDPDTVGHSNLNRTNFEISHIGKTKVSAMAELILSRRTVAIECYCSLIEDLSEDIVEPYELVVDCRDNVDPLPESIQKKVKITGGYDGTAITMHINPSGKKVWGDGESSYLTVPSFLVPPIDIASLIVKYITLNRPRTKEYIHNIDSKKLFNCFLNYKEPKNGL